MNGMWSKSSKQFADRMETKVLKLGIGLGFGILKGLGNSSSLSIRSTYAPSFPSYNLGSTPVDRSEIDKSDRAIGIVLLVLAPIFQFLGFWSYSSWGWWAFFALLLFSTLSLTCIVLAGTTGETMFESSPKTSNCLLILSGIEGVIFLFTNLWPIIVKDPDISLLSFFLMSLQIFAIIAVAFAIWKEHKENNASSESIVSVIPKETSLQRRAKDGLDDLLGDVDERI